MTTHLNIKVPYMARVEGEGALDIVVEDGEIKHLELNIFEPPRFFEAFLQGRSYMEAPDLTARICGICPVAYQMSSSHAMEKILGIQISPEIRTLRRLLYCAEWIESHALHIFLLHAPDFLGYESAISMAANPDLLPAVEMGLRMKKHGNELLAVIGGREIHPLSPTVGGFYRAPTKKELLALKEDFEWGLQASIDTVAWTATLDFPDFAPDYEFVSLRHPDEYPMNEGNVVSSKGLDIPMEAFEEFFINDHVAHSNAVHVHREHGGAYNTGPQARVNLNLDKLSPLAKKALDDTGIPFPEQQPVCQHRGAGGGVGARLRGSVGDHRQLREAAAEPHHRQAQGGLGMSHHRSAARHPLPSLHTGRCRTDPERPHRCAHRPESEAHGRGSVGLCAPGAGDVA